MTDGVYDASGGTAPRGGRPPSVPPAGAAARVVAGRYELLRSLGRGAMGVVWEARDVLLSRNVAIKEVLLPPDLPPAEHEIACRRTLREARAIAGLSHPNVVTLYDVLDSDDRPWIVMELLRARSLGEVLAQDGPLPVARVATIGLAVLGALEAAHDADIVHRDIKPGNILLLDDGRVKLTDFGIARAGGDSRLTQQGFLVGSPAYLPPEVARGGVAGPPADMWGLGCTLYAAVLGRPPFDRGDPTSTLTAVLREPTPALDRTGALGPVIDSLLDKDPERRVTAVETRRLLLGVARGFDRGANRGAAGMGYPSGAAPAVGSEAGRPGTEGVAAGGAGAAAAGALGAAAAGLGAAASAGQAAGPAAGSGSQQGAAQSRERMAPTPPYGQPPVSAAGVPSGQQWPAPNQPAYNQPTYNQPPYNQPPYNQAASNQAVYNQPTYTQPGVTGSVAGGPGTGGPNGPGGPGYGPPQGPRSPQGPGGDDGGRKERRPGRTAAALLIVLFLCVGTALGAYWLTGQLTGGGDAKTASDNQTSNPTGADSTAPTTAGSGKSSSSPTPKKSDKSPAPSKSGGKSSTSPSKKPSSKPSKKPAKKPDSTAIPAGYGKYDDGRGFTVGVPHGWSKSVVRDGVVDLTKPGGGGYLRLITGPPPGSGVLANMQEGETEFKPGHADYHRIRIQQVQYRGWPAAVWEFTYTGDDGVARHVQYLSFVTNNVNYALYISAPTASYGQLVPVLQTAQNTFKTG